MQELSGGQYPSLVVQIHQGILFAYIPMSNQKSHPRNQVDIAHLDDIPINRNTQNKASQNIR